MEHSPEPGFWVRNFVRPLLTRERLAWTMPGTGGETVLMALAKAGNLSWVAPNNLFHNGLNQRQGLTAQTALGASISQHPDRTPAHLMTAENLLDFDGELNQSRLASIYYNNKLDKLQIKPEFGHLASEMREQVARGIAHHETQLDPAKRMPLDGLNPTGTDDYYLDRIAGGKRWLAQFDQVFPPAEKKPQVRVLSLDGETPAPTKIPAVEAAHDLPEIPHIPRGAGQMSESHSSHHLGKGR